MDIKAMIQALREKLTPSRPPLDEEAAVASQGAEAIARRLPASVMPMQAIEADRRRKAQIEQMLADSTK